MLLTPPGFAQSYDVNISAQKLHKALIQLGKQSQASIVFPTHLRKPLKTPALNGRYTINQALDLLLNDTGLQYRRINSKVFAIVPAPVLETSASEHTAEPVYTGQSSIESVEVIGQHITGSRLRRTDIEGSAPIDVISSQQLQQDGAFSLGGYLKFLPAVAGNSTNTAVSNGGNGTATVTLRGLPANNTLVLMNGQRLEFDGLAGDAVDLNSIPLGVIERVEVLKDGASAIYGSDAIAGVVNIVMKRSSDGLAFEQVAGISRRGDANTRLSSLEFGQDFYNKGYIVAVNHYDQSGIFSRERSLSRSADSRSRGGTDRRVTATPSARIHFDNETQLIIDEAYRERAEGGSSIDHYRAATSEDLFDFRSQTSSISPADRLGAYFAGFIDINDVLTLNGNVQYHQTEAEISFASTPIYTASTRGSATIVSKDNRYNPFGIDIVDVRRRMLEFGERLQSNETETWRLSGELGYSDEKRDAAAAIYMGRTTATETFSGLIDGDRLRRALGPSEACLGAELDGCEPLNIFAPANSVSQDSVDYLSTSFKSRGFSELLGINAHISQRVMTIPAGDVMFAMGTDIRYERSRLNNRSTTQADLINMVGGTGSPESRGDRRTSELYSELQIPIAKHQPYIYNLDLELALRYSHYSSFGEQVVPKIGLRYRPLSSLLLRATRSEGFRAPSIKELHRTGFTTFALLDDPCSRPDNVGVLPGCTQLSDASRTQFLTVFTGDPDLKPERSHSMTAGVFWTPEQLPRLSFSVDVFQIIQRNVIDADPQTIVNQNAYNNVFSDLITRDEFGNLNAIQAPFINIGRKDIAGVDMSLHYSHQTRRLGAFQYQINASHIHHYKVKINALSEQRDFAGVFTDAATEGNGSLPRWKSNIGLQWEKGNYSAAYNINYVGSQTEFIPRLNTKRGIKSWQSHDVQFAAELGAKQQLKLTLGIDNLWDTPPPFIAEAFNDSYDARTYDIRGQYVYIKVRYQR